ncbi:MAG TPA: hypothetical protein VNA89_15225 [Gemmatimonadaceae bacterium]|nr:hypothetical protein [Gemmatimonadaceae bacterium]
MPSTGFTEEIEKSVLEPAAAARIEPALAASTSPDVWVHRYEGADSGWRLSIATHAEPGSGKMSLGGFRIAPEGRTDVPGYDNDREAIGLAIGMEEKIYWSRLLRVGGPLGVREAHRIVGGKCVLQPTADARVGRLRDRALLDFAIGCFRDFESGTGIHLTTGQDLGHGLMSDGVTPSLAYLNQRFRGSVLADTSKPTAEGNFHLLLGMLRAFGVAPEGARIALVGVGNIGRHLLGRLRALGARVEALEISPATRSALEESGVRAWPVEDKAAFLARPADAVVVNAAGGSLDRVAIDAVAANAEVKVVCGSENLAMPDPAGAAALLRARKVYAPTELGGMMGYLTAVEEYLSRREGKPFALDTLFEAACRLEVVGHAATSRVVAGGFRESFGEAVRAAFGGA